MKERAVLFQYRGGRSILHRIPALPKLALSLSLSLGIMFLPFYALCGAVPVPAILAFICGFSFREQFADVKPVLFYAAFLFLVNIFSGLPSPGFNVFKFEYLLYILRLLLVMQLSALFFRTTPSTGIKSAVCGLEADIRGAVKKLPFAKNISREAKFGTSLALTVSFIPELFGLWERLNRAYKARNGKGGIKKFRVLLIALFSLSFSYAEKKARALAAREGPVSVA
jgi:biotin transport system permease protein/energy-coupling factor transport system permease protein